MSLILDNGPEINSYVPADEVISERVGKTVFEILASNNILDGSEEYSKDFVMSVTHNGDKTVPDEQGPPPRPYQPPTPPSGPRPSR